MAIPAITGIMSPVVLPHQNFIGQIFIQVFILFVCLFVCLSEARPQLTLWLVRGKHAIDPSAYPKSPNINNNNNSNTNNNSNDNDNNNNNNNNDNNSSSKTDTTLSKTRKSQFDEFLQENRLLSTVLLQCYSVAVLQCCSVSVLQCVLL